MRSSIAIAVALVLLLGACASAPAVPGPAPEPEACRDPLYLELKGEHPDSLSVQAWERFEQLEAACRAEQTRQAERPTLGDSGRHRAAWLWMPAMMLFGGMMWLMMGAF